MKKSPTNPENSNGSLQLIWLSRDDVLRVLLELGYSEDFKNRFITVVREIEFPFRRATIPNNLQISSVLLSFCLKDLGIPAERFYKRLPALRKSDD
ncbi:MAG TPA: hypothetical protein PKV71_08185 [Calditrichia bacterium]|nr:hypothetical protein [Calditrichota bacterium]HQU72465.1 hypothetical protein [Calditrichia bacterium]HQV31841.1 hypothetical protein [Calditrichia bacterium]